MLCMLMLAAAGLAEGTLQQLLLGLSLGGANVYLWQWLDIRNKRMRYLGLFLTAFLICLVYLQILNAIDLGYSDGILYGAVSGYHEYYDISEYFYESIYLYQVLTDPVGRDLWLSGAYPYFGTYGPYNPFILLNTALMGIYGENIISLTLFKLHFTVASIYLLFKMSAIFVGIRGALYVTALYHLYPGYLLTASTLLRDNIIACLMIYLVWIVVGTSLHRKHFTFVRITVVLCVAAMLMALRNYAFIILCAALFVYYCWPADGRRQGGGLTTGLICLSLIGSGAVIVYSEQFSTLFIEDGTHIWEGAATPGFARTILRIAYFSFLGQPAVPEHYNLASIAEVMNLSSYIYLHAILISSLGALLCCRMEQVSGPGGRPLVIFGYMMPVAFLVLLTYVFGWPIPRLYNMWLWMTVILVVHFYCSLDQWRRNLLACCVASCITLFYFIQVTPWIGMLRFGAVFK